MERNIPKIEWGLALVRDLSIKEKLLFWANTFLDKPYISSPLGEGEDAPRYRFDGFDCMTYMETCLALAISNWSGDILRNLDKIRYKDGQVSFHTRCHFVVADWLPNNRALLMPLEDLFDSSVTRTINRSKFFEEKNRPLPENISIKKREEVTLGFITRGKINEIPPGRINGSIVLFIGNEDWIIVSHMGLVFEEDRKAILYHASKQSGSVVKQNLVDYVSFHEANLGVSFVSPIENENI